MTDNCLSTDTLKALVTGVLTEGDDATLHFRKCQQCQAAAGVLLEQLSGNAFLPSEGSLTGQLGHTSAPDAQQCQIGPYLIHEKLGEGGFGIVYRAEQCQPLRRTVALKAIKPGMDSREVIARFEGERHALALMDHPHIARVLDAGATPEGRPYFVMELVAGIPITDYCEQHHFSIRQRMELFITVCEAVQHAHQKGIIHRDLKPSNVLISEREGRPDAKVIDFGISKALTSSLTANTAMTTTGQMIGTIPYMSPEQICGSDVDTRSDVYSLGALAYELLTGTTPFEKERLKQVGRLEAVRIIREVEPQRPSARIATLGDTAINQGQTSSRDLMRQVRGDLDWIIFRTLEKDRERRYASASDLVADVRRYLRHEPVLACPPTTTYLVSKFIGRNKIALGTVALIVVAVLTGTAVAVSQAIVANTEWTRAELAVKAKQQEADRFRDLRYSAEIRLAGQHIYSGDDEQAELLLNRWIPKQANRIAVASNGGYSNKN